MLKRLETFVALFILLVICQLASFLAPLRYLWALVTLNDDRAFEIARAYDKLGNAVTNGRSDEFLSTRANRARAEGRRWGCWLCGLLASIQKDHCKKSPAVPGH